MVSPIRTGGGTIDLILGLVLASPSSSAIKLSHERVHKNPSSTTSNIVH
jgi:hypothetical protein